MPEVVLESQLAVEECRDRLHRSARRLNLWHMGWVSPQGTVLAQQRGDRFRLYAVGPPMVGNSYAPHFYGRFEAKQTGTLIRGKFGLSHFMLAFSIAWFGAIAAVEGALVIAAVAQLATGHRILDASPLVAVSAPLGLLAAGWGILKFGRWMGRRQEQRIIEFLGETLAATQLDSGPDTTQAPHRGQET